jgi:hypothetical protein
MRFVAVSRSHGTDSDCAKHYSFFLKALFQLGAGVFFD